MEVTSVSYTQPRSFHGGECRSARARDARGKEEVEVIFTAAGRTLSGALRMLLMRTAAEPASKFHPLVPNTETVEAM